MTGDAALLLDMLLAAEDARSFTASLDGQDFQASRLHQNAVIRSLEVIGEAAAKVSPACRDAPNPHRPEKTGGGRGEALPPRESSHNDRLCKIIGLHTKPRAMRQIPTRSRSGYVA